MLEKRTKVNGDSKKNKASKTKKDTHIEEIAVKRGFFYPAAEIYGGESGFYFYGSIGKLIKRRFENLWRDFFLSYNNFHEIEGTSILPEKVFQASGHLKHFNDILTECQNCHSRYRADQLIEEQLHKQVNNTDDINEIIEQKKLKCPKCGSNKFGKAIMFNMMFDVNIGSVKSDKGYLIPETAQLAYLAFKREFEINRKKLPLGLVVIEKVFRNEISPRQLFFRLREFTQAELQVFFDPDSIDDCSQFEEWGTIKKKGIKVLLTGNKKEQVLTLEQLNKKSIPKLYLFFMLKMQEFYLNVIKLPKEKIRFRQLSGDEKAFYNKIHFDVEAEIDSLGGFKEIAGLHYRTNYDLNNHQQASKQNLEVFFNNKTFLPHVIELSFGVDRNIYTLFDIFLKQEKVNNEKRILLALPPLLTPYDAAIFPLVNKEGMPEIAHNIFKELNKNFKCFYDASGSIGRRYRRQDEIGTPYCLTIDGQTLKDRTVTVRDRDSMKQQRVAINELVGYIKKKSS